MVHKIALYVAYGITTQGQRDIVAFYPGGGAESASEWARCLEDLKSKGLKDIPILGTDGMQNA